jgi:hypothetical protein
VKAATDVIASLSKQEHWAMSQEDAELVGKPLGRILDRMGVMKNLGKFADPIALIYGVSVTIVPRVIESGRIAKDRRKEREEHRGTISTEIQKRTGTVPATLVRAESPSSGSDGGTSGELGKVTSLGGIPSSDSGPV